MLLLYVRSCVLRIKNGSCNNWHIHHGAVADEAFAHLSLSVPVEGDSNEWCEPVTDEEYEKLR